MASSNPFPVGFRGWGLLDQQNHAAGGANGSIMVGMFVCLCFTSKKPSEREFFVPAGTDLCVKLLTWSFNYILHDIKSTTEKNAPTLLAISMAMWIRWYGVKRIAQYGRSRATLDATGRCHRASTRPVLPWRMPWSSISA